MFFMALRRPIWWSIVRKCNSLFKRLFRVRRALWTAWRETCCWTCSITLCCSKRMVSFLESSNCSKFAEVALMKSSFSRFIWEYPFIRISPALFSTSRKRTRACSSWLVADSHSSSEFRIVVNIISLRLSNILLNESRLSIQKLNHFLISSQTEHEPFNSFGFPAQVFMGARINPFFHQACPFSSYYVKIGSIYQRPKSPKGSFAKKDFFLSTKLFLCVFLLRVTFPSFPFFISIRVYSLLFLE